MGDFVQRAVKPCLPKQERDRDQGEEQLGGKPRRDFAELHSAVVDADEQSQGQREDAYVDFGSAAGDDSGNQGPKREYWQAHFNGPFAIDK